jgi:hypothetical protein
MVLGEDVAARIVACGALAPSGDNLQPWIVDRAGDTIRVSVDQSRDRSLYNFRSRASLIAIGAMAENMVIAGREFGVRADVAISSPPGQLPSVTLSFSEPCEKGDPLYKAIALRCTNRKPYDRRPLEAGVLASLSGAVAADGRSDLRFIQDPVQMKTVARAAALNDRLLFEWRELHDTFFESVRWTEAEAEATKDGLFVKTLELGPMAAGFKMMRSWRMTSLANYLGSSRTAPFHSYQTFLRSGGFGFLRMAGDSEADLVEGGRRLQRIWLTATSLGLGFQPMAGMLYLLSYLRAEQSRATGSQAALLLRAEGLFRRVLTFDDGFQPIMLFRIGRAAGPTATSLRRDVDLAVVSPESPSIRTRSL